MRTRILFVCYANMIRSQMAEGFARDLGEAFIDAYSAGVHPMGQVSEEAIEVMQEKGIDITAQHSKGLREVPIDEMDYVVSMTNRSASDICPPGFEGVALDWDIQDPVGEPVDRFRMTRDDIEGKVRDLIQRIWQDGGSSNDG
ncbi:MAG: arsenate reductase ArsC [Candidatus Krumholzibacteria bacterium]|nr:arsenate reductase ArsC [Candidatus Krumholzibacteria bacterium]